jgi:hypothetical protein
MPEVPPTPTTITWSRRMHRSRPSPIIAALTVALTLSVVACTGAPPAPTASPTSAAATSAPITAPPTARPPTAAPPTGAPTRSATAEPPPATPTALLTPDAADTVRDLASVSGALAAGTYRLNLDPSGPAELPPILITVPEGWSRYANWALFADPQDAEGGTDDNIALMFWDVGGVYGHPCSSRGTLFDPGPTVDALAAALVDIPLRNATVPTDVTVDGYAGKYLEWSVPGEADFSECDTNDYVSWTAKGWASERYQQAPGQVDQLWIVGVEGVRLVINAFYMPWTTGADREELQEVVESIRFER